MRLGGRPDHRELVHRGCGMSGQADGRPRHVGHLVSGGFVQRHCRQFDAGSPRPGLSGRPFVDGPCGCVLHHRRSVFRDLYREHRGARHHEHLQRLLQLQCPIRGGRQAGEVGRLKPRFLKVSYLRHSRAVASDPGLGPPMPVQSERPDAAARGPRSYVRS
jgi:hypothetical protein